MSTPPTLETSRKQLAAVGLSLGLLTLTFLVPLALAALAVTALLSFAVGAKSLRFAHGLDPGSFSAGFYLATLLLFSAGGWQVAHTVKAWLARRTKKEPGSEAGPSESVARAQKKGLPASLAQRPWTLLGLALLVVDMSLVRWEIRGRLDSPDGLLAAAILASMVWATIFMAMASIRLTGLLWRALLRSSRRSPYAAGLVTAFSLAISLASVLALRSYARELVESASQQGVVASLEEAPSSDSSLEQVRLALVEFAEPKKTSAGTQPLIKEAQPSPPPQVQAATEPTIAQPTAAAAAAEPTADAATAQPTADPLAPTALGIAGVGAAALPPSPTPPAEATAPTLPPAEVVPVAAATEPTEAEAPFLDLSFGPPFAGCVDRLTEQKSGSDPIEQHIRRLMARFGISEHDSRAIVIETLVSVCMKKAEDREDLRRYFWRSVTNAARNFVSRHLNGRRTCSIELVPVIDYPDETDTWRFADETEQRAQQAFCELSELDQALIQARVVEGQKFAQIGEIIGRNEDGARYLFDKALRQLKKNFEKK